MTLEKKSWFTSKHCLFLGERELLDHQQVADIISNVHASGSHNYLHVFVRTQDVKHGKLLTSRSSMSFGNLAHVNEQEEGAGAIMPDSGQQLVTRSASRDALVPAVDDTTVLHIIIRKTAHVSWQPGKDGAFQLTVQASETPADVKHKLLPCAKSACPSILEDITLLHNGVHMEADRPLLEYGLHDGSVLDLVPWDPVARPTVAPAAEARPAAVQSSAIVPALSSPTHDLYRNWQLAASGLRAGANRDLLNACCF